MNNPLCGEQAASAIFAPKKGATPACVKFLDQGLAHYSERIKHCLGIELVLETVYLDSYMQDVDLVITGEGSIDAQTVHGKTPDAMSLEQALQKTEQNITNPAQNVAQLRTVKLTK